MDILIIYLLIINALSFILMLADKRKAIKKAWRIPEATLLAIAAIGGSLGSLVGMRLFHHKTKHLKFSLGLPLMLAVHIIILIFIYINAA